MTETFRTIEEYGNICVGQIYSIEAAKEVIQMSGVVKLAQIRLLDDGTLQAVLEQQEQFITTKVYVTLDMLMREDPETRRRYFRRCG